MPRKFRAFLSYSRRDEAIARMATSMLQLGKQHVFCDVQDTAPGDDWKHRIQDAIANSVVVAVLWCCDAAASEWVAKEVRWARRLKRPIVPILLCPYPVPAALAAIQWIDLRPFLWSYHSWCEHGEEGEAEDAPKEPSPKPAVPVKPALLLKSRDAAVLSPTKRKGPRSLRDKEAWWQAKEKAVRALARTVADIVLAQHKAQSSEKVSPKPLKDDPWEEKYGTLVTNAAALGSRPYRRTVRRTIQLIVLGLCGHGEKKTRKR